MTTYIALLRGINVSGQKKIKMADLRSLMEKWGFQAIETYIQSGNIIFKSDEKDTRLLEEIIKNGIAKGYGFEVPVLVKRRGDIEKIIKQNPYSQVKDGEGYSTYFVLLKSEPKNELMEALRKETYENEKFVITKTCIYLACLKGYGKAKCDNNFFERKLKVGATTRNYRTMIKLLEMIG